MHVYTCIHNKEWRALSWFAVTMGRRLNDMAARLRILQGTVHRAAGRPCLQEVSLDVHRFYCILLGRNIHFASHAADQSRHLVTDAHHRWAKHVHRTAATQRHEFQDDIDAELGNNSSLVPGDNTAAAPSPAGAIEYADLEKTLKAKALRSCPSRLDPDAAEFVPLCHFKAPRTTSS